MAFTYDIATDRGKVRLFLGDSVQDKGPRPRKTNYADAEIDYFLTTQSSSINRSVAMGLDALANEWLSYSLQEKEGDVSYDAKGLAESFFKLSKEWWNKPDDGGASGSLTAGVIITEIAEQGEIP